MLRKMILLYLISIKINKYIIYPYLYRRIKINKMNLKLFINLKFIYLFSLKYCGIKHSLRRKEK